MTGSEDAHVGTKTFADYLRNEPGLEAGDQVVIKISSETDEAFATIVHVLGKDSTTLDFSVPKVEGAAEVRRA